MAEAMPVICHRVADCPVAPVEYSAAVPCWRCNAPCWISPATLASVAGKEWRAECLRCASGRPPGSLRPLPRTAGQVAERGGS